eukprot:GGOE01049466.1.p1 GENE.GGOE01049466.1~~GGOE01049466.1.p1  ORF type:complete len:422 (-),score=98.88 GGOE01049466.1:152-1357(-)
MCDYWKSVPMWRCPYCKCNIQDTKAARQFHENGRRHKETVERHMLLMGIKGLQRQKAQTDVERELRIIEAAALSSYMTHDLNGVLECVPEKDIKALPQVGKSLREQYQTVSSTTSANPEYGTPEYTQWYHAWKQYYTSQGQEKAIAHIPAPPEACSPRSPSNGQKFSPTGAPAKSKGQSQPRRPPKSPKADPRAPSHPGAPSAAESTSSPAVVPQQRNYEEDDQLESCDVGDDSCGPLFSAWSTVAVRPLCSSTAAPNHNDSSGEEEAEEEELPDSCEEENGGPGGYRSLSFNFSKRPEATSGSAQTGFRVTTYVKEEAPAPTQSVASLLQAQAVDAETLARHLVPLSERRERPVKLEATGLKEELEDERISPAGLKRPAPQQFASRGKRQYRRRGDEEGD